MKKDSFQDQNQSDKKPEEKSRPLDKNIIGQNNPSTMDYAKWFQKSPAERQKNTNKSTTQQEADPIHSRHQKPLSQNNNLETDNSTNKNSSTLSKL